MLAIAIPLALGLHTFVTQVYSISGHSMAPTLQDGQRVVVDKVRPALGEIERGDLIIFISPEDPAKNLIKRVIGIGGDRIELVGDLVLGQPAGIVISPDETHLVVSAVTNLSETTVIYRVEIGTGAIVNAYSPANVAANRESAGLHCARNAPVCSWANAGDGGDTGQVYVVTLEVAP